MPTLLFQFKHLMLSIHPDDDDDDDIPPPPSQSGHGTPAAAGGQAGGNALDAAQGGPETGESQDSKPVAVIDLSGDGDGDNGGRKVSTVISS